MILQRLRDAENEKNYGEFSAREGDIVAGVIQRDARANARGLVVVRMGSETKGSEGVIPAAEQVPGERYEHGDRLRCYVVGVTRGAREPLITLSRTHPNLVRKLFSLEVPEIADGSVEIVAVAREAGHRSKIAVTSRVPGLNAKGACIGPMGQRVRNVMSELSGEKIDIIDYDEDPARFVANALSPAKVVSVSVIDEAARAARVVVPGFPAVAGDRQGGPERPAGGPADRLADRHPQRRAPADSPSGPRRGPPARCTARYRDAASPAQPFPFAGCGDGRLSCDPARDFGSDAEKRDRHLGWTGADLRWLPETRAGRRTASSCRCRRREWRLRRDR